MTKSELEALLREFDEALMQAFPGPEPMSVLLVGGACLLLQGITAHPTNSVDVIIVDPMDLGYLLACKLMLGRHEKDGADIAVLRQVLAIQSRAQAQQIVDRYFPSPAQQAMYRLPCTLERVFGK